MADEEKVKLSELPSAELPLSGNEMVPLVQGGVTKKAPVSALGLPVLISEDPPEVFRRSYTVVSSDMVPSSAIGRPLYPSPFNWWKEIPGFDFSAPLEGPYVQVEDNGNSYTFKLLIDQVSVASWSSADGDYPANIGDVTAWINDNPSGMTLGGPISPSGAAGLAVDAGTFGGKACYMTTPVALLFTEDSFQPVDTLPDGYWVAVYWDNIDVRWVVEVWYNGSSASAAWYSNSNVATPDLASGWTPVGAASAGLTVTLTAGDGSSGTFTLSEIAEGDIPEGYDEWSGDKGGPGQLWLEDGSQVWICLQSPGSWQKLAFAGEPS